MVRARAEHVGSEDAEVPRTRLSETIFATETRRVRLWSARNSRAQYCGDFP